MLLGESVRIGITEIRMHKLRSLLTMLGVIFGIAAVIGVSSIGAGAAAGLNKQLALLGTNTIRVRKVELKGPDAVSARRNSPYGMTLDDAAAIREVLPSIESLSPIKYRKDLNAFSGDETLQADIVGAGPELPQVVGYRMKTGRFISDIDEKEAKQVVVIGADVRRAAFPLEDPVGKQLVIAGQLYTVIGVVAARGSGGGETVIDVGNVDRQIFLPVNTVLRRLSPNTDPRAHNLDEIVIKVGDEALHASTAQVVENLLSRRHREAKDFELLIPEELIRQQQEAEAIFQNVLIFVAGLSLLVGGIGIMNIMLATVTQRTREIGIRRALGATRNDILGQFLIESLIISLLGGGIGIGIGYAMAEGMEQYVGFETLIPMQAVVLATGVAAGVGFVFGFYPSMKAAQLDPIEALRSE
ncbi:MAG: ABC transporter permease [Sumerlaeia bacterium]